MPSPATQTFTPTATFTCAVNQVWGETSTNPSSSSMVGTWAQRYSLAQPAQVNLLAAQLTGVTAGTTVHMGIYTDNPATPKPDTLIYLTAPQVATNGLNNFVILAGNPSLAAGTYWLAINNISGSMSLSGGASINGDWYQDVGQDMPNPFPLTPHSFTYFTNYFSAIVNTCAFGPPSTPLPTYTTTDTPTNTPTSSFTPTATWTNTSTFTPTFTPTNSFTPTPTPSSTNTPTNSPTPTNTPTLTITPTPVNTPATPTCAGSSPVGFLSYPLNMPVTESYVSYEAVTTTSGSVINSIHAYFIDSGVPAVLGLYSDNSNAPATLLGSTNSFTSVPGWNTQALTAPVSVTASTNLWFAIYVSGTPGKVYLMGGFNSGGPGQLIQTGAPSLPSPTAGVAVTTVAGYLTMYADICP